MSLPMFFLSSVIETSFAGVCVQRLENPNGISPQSPGLRVGELPWVGESACLNPEGGSAIHTKHVHLSLGLLNFGG